uniref:Uncharacterized protein n=1 Tax=Prolemur simus TaxID=1328070 RepID=A0A8C8YDM8_PROSS
MPGSTSPPLPCAIVLILHDHEETLRGKWKQRKKNPRSLMMTWALVFLTKSLLQHVQ